MVNGQEFLEAIYSIADEKRIDKDIILEGVREGFQKAYEKYFDPDAIIRVDIDQEAGQIKVFRELAVVQKVEDEISEISLTEAQAKYDADAVVGGVVYEPVVFDDEFSRLAIVHVGQIIKQKIREGEKQKIYEEFADKEFKLIYGEVKDLTESNYLVSVDGSIIPIWNKKMIPGESFNIGQTIGFYVENISKDDKHSQVQGTRTHPGFLQRLMESEIQEIGEGSVEIKAVSREPGKRAKVAVYSYDSTIDAIGACVGAGGQRIRSITNQLSGEKIDIILWDENYEKFIINAMAPVRVISIDLDLEYEEVTLVVPDEQLSLAIGRHGVSSKLVANLINLKVNIVSLSDAAGFGIEVLWNGNITKEELESHEFLNNINRRRGGDDKRKRGAHKDEAQQDAKKASAHDEIDETNFVQATSIDEIQENINLFDEIADSSNETADFNVDELDDTYDEYYEK
jgi:N utilization substance protein A